MEIALLLIWGPIILAGLAKSAIAIHNTVNNVNEAHEALSKCDFKN